TSSSGTWPSSFCCRRASWLVRAVRVWPSPSCSSRASRRRSSSCTFQTALASPRKRRSPSISCWKRRSFSRVMWRTRSTMSCIGSEVPTIVPSRSSALAGGFRDFDPVCNFPYLRDVVKGLALLRPEVAAHAGDLLRRLGALGRGLALPAAALEGPRQQQVQAVGAGVAAARLRLVETGAGRLLRAGQVAVGERGPRHQLGGAQPQP